MGYPTPLRLLFASEVTESRTLLASDLVLPKMRRHFLLRAGRQFGRAMCRLCRRRPIQLFPALSSRHQEIPTGRARFSLWDGVVAAAGKEPSRVRRRREAMQRRRSGGGVAAPAVRTSSK